MAKVHHGGKVGKAASRLASKGTSKSKKSTSARTLASHKHNMHQLTDSSRPKEVRKMARVRIKIPTYRVTKTGRIVKTGTKTKSVKVK